MYSLTFHQVIGRGVFNRRAALDWIRTYAEQSGVIYFADDDNSYDVRIFEEIRQTKIVSVFPVGLILKFGVSSPIVRQVQSILIDKLKGRLLPSWNIRLKINAQEIDWIRLDLYPLCSIVFVEIFSFSNLRLTVNKHSLHGTKGSTLMTTVELLSRLSRFVQIYPVFFPVLSSFILLYPVCPVLISFIQFYTGIIQFYPVFLSIFVHFYPVLCSSLLYTFTNTTWLWPIGRIHNYEDRHIFKFHWVASFSSIKVASCMGNPVL